MTSAIQTLPPRVAVLPDVLTVKVDAEDIALGQRRNSRECPIARATRRTLALMGHQPDEVVVGGYFGGYSTVSIVWGLGLSADGHQLFKNDSAAFMTAYDSGGNPPPCTVTLQRLDQ